MPLSKKLQSVTIQNRGYSASSGDWLYTFTLKDGSFDITPVNYGGSYDEAIDGSLRSNLRGLRFTLSVNWEKLHNATVTERKNTATTDSPSRVSSFLDSMVQSLATDGDSHVEVSWQGALGATQDMIPDTSSLRTVYTNQIARSTSSLTFIGTDILTTIPSQIQAPTL